MGNLHPLIKKLFTPWNIIWLIFTLGCLVVWSLSLDPLGNELEFPSTPVVAEFIGFFVGVGYFVIQLASCLIYSQWQQALLELLRVAILVLGIFVGYRYGETLTIPSNVKISQVVPWNGSKPGEDDVFQKAVIASLNKPTGPSTAIIPSAPSLRRLLATNKPLLMRYLEASAAWRVYQGWDPTVGRIKPYYATRRWQLGSRWSWQSHGEYFESDINLTNTDFTLETSLDLSGASQFNSISSTWMDEGTVAASVSLDHQTKGLSECFIRCGGGVALDILEVSPGPERRMTEAAIKQVDAECQAILQHHDFDSSLLAPGSIHHGEPTFNLYEAHGASHYYEVETWVNPGEKGTVYLKAYEMSRHYPIGGDSLYLEWNERMGWSPNPNELFLSSSTIGFIEGRDLSYAVHLELWFKPDLGTAERKLIERNYILTGNGSF